MNERLLNLINSIRQSSSPDNFVFPAKKGGLIDWHNFRTRAWKKIIDSIPGIEYRNPYQMRHTCITLMLRNGADSTVVAKWVGNSPSIIARYYLGDVSDIAMTDT